MQRTLYRLSLTALVCMYLVIIAGSVVRMTGSGMGCPDWPKCFGYYIPPTDLETLTWSPQRSFDAGNIIIQDEALFVAKENFISGDSFVAQNWEPYTKHDYALFNPVHTWVEYINRLVGAFSGLPVLALFIWSLLSFAKNKRVVALSFLGILLLGFEAWLGKEVVDGNLIPHQITYHMFGAIALVALFVYLVVLLKPVEGISFRPKRDMKIVGMALIALLLLLIQIYFGTNVREGVDSIGKENLLATVDWIEDLGPMFKIHRSFSILILLFIGWFSVKTIRTRTVSTWPRILLVTIFLEAFCGIGLAYLNMPAALQPFHLVLAIVDVGIILFILFEYMKRTQARA